MRPYESWGRDFDRDFIEKARFQCRVCGKDCRLTEGFLKAEEDKMFASGRCSECGAELRYDVTNVWREE
jgi:transcription elongation factor Elf1